MRSAARLSSLHWISLPSNSLLTIAKSIPALVLVIAACILSGCSGGGASGSSGGGGGGSSVADFALTIPAQVTVQSGGLPQSFQIAFGSSQNNLPVTVTISSVGSGLNLYGGSTYKFTDAVATPSYTWAVSAAAGAAAGSSSFSVSATNGSVTHNWTINVTITQAASFQVNLAPSTLTLLPGESSSIAATVSGSNIPSNLSLAVSSYPSGSQYPSIVAVEPHGDNTWTLVVAPPPVTTPGPIALFVQASSGTATSTAVGTLNLTLQSFPAVTALTRSNFVRGGDFPGGAVYDAARKLVFVAYGNLNQVVVYSSVDQHIVATIPVAQYQPVALRAQTIDESADGSRVYVGGAGQIAIIDPALLQVLGIERTPTVSPGYGTPVQVATLADGKVLVENSDYHVYLWDPTAHTFTADDPPTVPGAAFAGGLMRSADHSTSLLFGSNGAIFFSASGDTYGNYGTNLSGTLAVSPDGSRVVSACGTGGATPPIEVTFYDNAFNVLGSPAQPGFPCSVPAIGAPLYSLDGKTVYFFKDSLGIAYDAVRFAPIGLITTNSSTSVTEPFAIDESGLVFGRSSLAAGLAVTDASDPGAIEPDNATTFAFPNVNASTAVKQNLLALGSTVQNFLLGTGFDPNVEYGVYVGLPPGTSGSKQASGVSVASTTQLNFTSPASNTPGPVNVTVTRNDGWNTVLPDAITYGPDLIGVYPNAIPANKTAKMTAVGYGLVIDGGTTTLGGSTASEATASLFPEATLYYPLTAMQITTNSGTPGWADLIYTNQTGTTTLHHAVQFLKGVNTYAMTGSPDALVYDKTHQRVYVSNTTANNVAVFDLASSAFCRRSRLGMLPQCLRSLPMTARWLC